MKRLAWLADLHVHSNFSDGTMSIPELVDFYGRRGFGAIAITDHICELKSTLGRAAHYLNCTLRESTFSEYMRILTEEARRAMDKYQLLVIPGIEVSKNSWSNHRSAHLLGLGISEYVGADGDIVEIAQRIRQQGALVCAAHPVPTRKFEPQTLHLWNRRDELKDIIDAWEVASGPHLFEEVLESGLPMIATSDLHRPAQINSWKTVFSCERELSSVFSAIKSQDLKFRLYDESRSPIPLSPWIPNERPAEGSLTDRFLKLSGKPT